MVEVRKTGVSASPHSPAASIPVHSPAPLSTAPPAGTGKRNRSPPGSTTVTPVRAVPRPAGGGGSSRHTVACPSPAPGTASTDPVGPGGSSPRVMPRSGTRGIPRWYPPQRRLGRVRVSLPVPVVWSEDCLRHEPGGEVWLGLREPGTEVPARALVLRDALAAPGPPVTAAQEHDDTILRRVHDPGLLGHLATVWADWEAAGLPAEYGRDRVVPYVFPTPGLLAGLPARIPPAVHARAGLYCYDTMTLVGPGSWAAIRGAADAAQTAADLVSSGRPAAYALCRPPGHHATRSAYGGSCYLNNAAIAAEALRAAGAARVAVLDIDAHHGNGTQMIFWDRADVWYGSLHVDPGAGWFPHYAGYADERGTGPGSGSCAPRRRRPPRTPWWSPWAWTRRPPTPRARFRSPRPPTGPPGSGPPRWARPSSSRKAATTWPPWAPWPSRRWTVPPPPHPPDRAVSAVHRVRPDAHDAPH